MHLQSVFLTELFQALITLMWLFFVMYSIHVLRQMALLTEFLHALVTLVWFLFDVNTLNVPLQVAFAGILKDSEGF